MTNVVVAFSKPEDAKNIRNILVRNGFSITAVCTSGAGAISCADGLGRGVIVCGGRFSDMIYRDIHECLPCGVRMLLVASPGALNGSVPTDVVCLGLPLKVHELVSTLEMMIQAQAKQQKKQKLKREERSEREQEMICRAKSLLMDRNHMTESEAHHYIQKCSMDSGTNMTETAQMILSLMSI